MSYDISIIRPQTLFDEVKMRGQGVSFENLKRIKKALLSLHCLEMTATSIYRYQISKKNTEHNHQLIAAMYNEMTHYQDFQLQIFEYDWRPKILRLGYWFAGFCIVSRMMGEKAVLRVGIWVESRAVKDYARLLREVNWDEDTRRVIEKNQADEKGHVRRWEKLLEELNEH